MGDPVPPGTGKPVSDYARRKLRGKYDKSYHQVYASLNKDRLRSVRRKSDMERRHNLRSIVDSLKNYSCKDRSIIRSSYLMQFDHREPSLKIKDICRMINDCEPKQRILDEIEKCDLVCIMCHRLRTWIRSEKLGTKNKRLNKNRQLINELKSFPCKDCDTSYHYSQMDFDHINSKKFSISSGMIKGIGKLKEELLKTELLCAICHAERTYLRNSIG